MQLLQEARENKMDVESDDGWEATTAQAVTEAEPPQQMQQG